VSWLQLTIAVARDAADGVTALLEGHGAAAVTLSAAGREELLEPLPGEHPLWDAVRLDALLPPDADLRALRAALATAGSRIADVELVAEDDWQSRWRAHAVRARFGERLWLLPRDEPLEPAAADDPAAVVLRLDPGLAFGSGSHATTRLCLAGLAGFDLEGLRVLDYGCGSGVLAVASALLGAAEVVAVDHDPQALLATRDNAAYNQVSESRLRAIAPDALTGPAVADDAFDLVVANILANPLVTLAPRLTALTRPGGRVMLSGLLAEQAGMIRAAYPEVVFEDPVREAEWIRLDGRRS
jgi:ribosomal protein L11 methyltransferase